MPLAVTMGVPWAECNVVGALIGKKIIVNEFLAYIDLGALINDAALSVSIQVVCIYIQTFHLCLFVVLKPHLLCLWNINRGYVVVYGCSCDVSLRLCCQSM